VTRGFAIPAVELSEPGNSGLGGFTNNAGDQLITDNNGSVKNAVHDIGSRGHDELAAREESFARSDAMRAAIALIRRHPHADRWPDEGDTGHRDLLSQWADDNRAVREVLRKDSKGTSLRWLLDSAREFIETEDERLEAAWRRAQPILAAPPPAARCLYAVLMAIASVLPEQAAQSPLPVGGRNVILSNQVALGMINWMFGTRYSSKATITQARVALISVGLLTAKAGKAWGNCGGKTVSTAYSLLPELSETELALFPGRGRASSVASGLASSGSCPERPELGLEGLRVMGLLVQGQRLAKAEARDEALRKPVPLERQIRDKAARAAPEGTMPPSPRPLEMPPAGWEEVMLGIPSSGLGSAVTSYREGITYGRKGARDGDARPAGGPGGGPAVRREHGRGRHGVRDADHGGPGVADGRAGRDAVGPTGGRPGAGDSADDGGAGVVLSRRAPLYTFDDLVRAARECA
jgi:hypothetical protein